MAITPLSPGCSRHIIHNRYVSPLKIHICKTILKVKFFLHRECKLLYQLRHLMRHNEQTLLPNVKCTGSVFKLLGDCKLDSQKGSSGCYLLTFH